MLQLNNIVKDYVVTKDLTVHALKGVSLKFRANEFVSILGPSGCGKTTMLNIIGGLDHYTSGDLVIDGISTKNYGEKQWNAYRNLRVGFVFQNYNLIPHQSIVENVELALTLSGISKQERRERAKQALIKVGLEKEIHKRPNQLSGGQMQRVAIARALVNNPQIVLADEPTGALDSSTGIQVMELLKKVAENHLVIMVTHNAELAEQYSTRIIRVKDGVIVDDTMPYDGKEDSVQQATTTTTTTTSTEIPVSNTAKTESPATDKPRKKDKKTVKVRMTWWTALALSFKNLISKKGRTIMTSIAGSIGIIGVALVLAISNGFNMYINNMQKETLSGYPLQISPISADINALQEQMMSGSQNNLPKFPENDNNVHIYDSSSILGDAVKYNMITQDYIDFIEKYYQEDQQKPAEQRNLTTITYSYQKQLNIFSKNGDKYTAVKNTSESSNPASAIIQSFMGSNSVFQEAMSNADYVKTQYDVYGKYPQASNEVAVIVDSRNRIDIDTLKALGIEYNKNEDGTYNNISFEDMLEKEFVLVYNNAYYIEEQGMMGKTFTELSSKSDSEIQQTMQTIVNDDSKSKTLKVVGVLRINENAPLELYGTGILYLPSLTEEFIANSVESNIAKAMTEDDGYVYVIANPDKKEYTKVSVSIAKTIVESKFKSKFTDAQIVDYCKHQVGASLTPSSISLYPTNFDAKDDIIKYLDGWNASEQGKSNPIYYTDATAVLTNSLGQLVNIISYVLIAFASISLIVSSVMIGIITYVSVIERTKEIGVLRSLGASKNNVSGIFNAESFLIGLTAGLFGIVITYILCIPINIILRAVAGSALTANIAVLNPLAGLALIAISCLLTLISSAIPARMAAKLDPVKALRTE